MLSPADRVCECIHNQPNPARWIMALGMHCSLDDLVAATGGWWCRRLHSRTVPCLSPRMAALTSPQISVSIEVYSILVSSDGLQMIGTKFLSNLHFYFWEEAIETLSRKRTAATGKAMSNLLKALSRSVRTIHVLTYWGVSVALAPTKVTAHSFFRKSHPVTPPPVWGRTVTISICLVRTVPGVPWETTVMGTRRR
jgi:hypothetical protein